MTRTGRWIAAIVAALIWAGKAPAEDLAIPGSGNCEYVLGQLAQIFNATQKEHRVTVPPSTGTAGALRDVEAGTASLGRVGRPLKPEERSRGLAYIPLGRDAVVFVAGAGVSVRTISPAQAVDVYAGRITDWRELGGAPGPVRAIGREQTDASRQAIARHVKPFETMAFGEGVKVVHLDPQMIELLDRYPTSLGFLNRSALSAARSKVVHLALDGMPATPENVESGRYPLSLEFGLVHRSGDLGAAGRAFVAFVQSPAAARWLREHDVLPARGAR